MPKLALTPDEIEHTRSLLADLTARFNSVEDPEFLDQVNVFAHELPRRIRQLQNEFRLHEPASALWVISGYPMDEERIGDTPKRWSDRVTPSPALAEEMLLTMLGSLLGDVIGWATQQNGYIVHDICPTPGHEGEQLGSGSEQLLWWHTEDAFHPYRGDYLGMLCLRNPDRVATTFACLEGLEIETPEARPLFEPKYVIRPDESHLKKNRGKESQEDGALLEASYSRIEEMNTRPERISVLSGNHKSPYIRVDPYFMDPADDPAAQSALDWLVQSIDAKLFDLVLEAGDFCFIDNWKAVHGRRPFRARYDGKDRWLKRINVTRDLRKSRIARRSAESRVIF